MPLLISLIRTQLTSLSRIRTLSLLTCLWACLLAGNVSAMPLTTGSVAPNWILPTPSGEHISFYQDSDQQAAVVVFWATWCKDCQVLLPELEKLRQSSNDHSSNKQNLKFYALNIQEDADPVRYMSKNNYGFTLLLRAEMVAKRYGSKGTAGVYVIGKDKKVLYIRSKGESPTEVIAAIKQALSL